jgi:hypothetical protein
MRLVCAHGFAQRWGISMQMYAGVWQQLFLFEMVTDHLCSPSDVTLVCLESGVGSGFDCGMVGRGAQSALHINYISGLGNLLC